MRPSGRRRRWFGTAATVTHSQKAKNGDAVAGRLQLLALLQQRHNRRIGERNARLWVAPAGLVTLFFWPQGRCTVHAAYLGPVHDLLDFLARLGNAVGRGVCAARVDERSHTHVEQKGLPPQTQNVILDHSRDKGAQALGCCGVHLGKALKLLLRLLQPARRIQRDNVRGSGPTAGQPACAHEQPPEPNALFFCWVGVAVGQNFAQRCRHRGRVGQAVGLCGLK